MNRFHLLSRGVSIQLRLRSVTEIGDSDDLPLPIVRLCIFNFAVELIHKPRYVVLSGDVGSHRRRFRTVAGRRVHLIGICAMRTWWWRIGIIETLPVNWIIYFYNMIGWIIIILWYDELYSTWSCNVIEKCYGERWWM